MAITKQELTEHVKHEHSKSIGSEHLKEIVYGGIDGIITTFAVVAGFSGVAALIAYGVGSLFHV